MPSATTKPHDKELGHVSSWAALGGFQNWSVDEIEETPAVQFPQSNRTFAQMWRSDAQVAGTFAAVTLPLRRDIYSLDPQDADPAKVARMADDIDLPVLGQDKRAPRQRRNGRFSWQEHNRQALLKLVYGFSVFEKVCEVIDGQVRLKKLGVRPPQTIAAINVAPDGGLISLEQWPLGSLNTGIGKRVTIPAEFLVWHSNDKEGSSWTGKSLFRAAYKDWLLKDRDMRVWSMSLERTGMGVPTITGAIDTTNDQGKELHAMAQAYRAGEGAGGYLPHGTELKLVGVTGSIPDHRAAIEYHDTQIARSMLAQFLQLGTTGSGSGSRALGSVFLDFFVLALDAIAQDIADTTTQHVVEYLWDQSYGTSEACPRIVARSIDTERDVPIDVVGQAVQSGLLEVDDALEDWARAKNGMPTRSTPRAAAPAPPPPSEPVQPLVNAVHAGHRGQVSAAIGGEDEIRSALGAQVDVAAIIAARAAGEGIESAVEAGLPTAGPLHGALLGLTTRAYEEGTSTAVAALPAGATRSATTPARLIDVLDDLGDRAAGMVDTLSRRLRAALAGGEAEGLAGTALSDLLAGVGDSIESARLIAVTETRRAAVAAALDVYAANGITEFEWVRTSGSNSDCICATNNGAVGPWSMADIPAHPRCSCILSPRVAAK